MSTTRLNNFIDTRSRRTLWLAGMLCLMMAPSATAQSTSAEHDAPAPAPVSIEKTQGPVRVSISLDRDAVAMAESFDMRVRIEAERDVMAGMADYKDILGAFEVVNRTSETVDCDDFHDCQEIVFTLRALLPGEATIPPLLFGYADARPKMDGATGTIEDRFETEPIPIRVENSLAGMRNPASLPMPLSLRILWWFLGTIAVLAIIGLIARWWFKRPRRIPYAAVVPQRSPYEWAMHELDRLIAENLIARNEHQEFYYRINGLLRQYIERRFDVMAGEQTSEEFIRSVQSMGALSMDQRETLQSFVAACDPVKYAKQLPSADESTWVLNAARDFINATRQDAFVTQPATTGQARSEVPT